MKYKINDFVLASPEDSIVQGFLAVVIDIIEGAEPVYIVKDQEDDLWQCNEGQLEAYDE